MKIHHRRLGCFSFFSHDLRTERSANGYQDDIGLNMEKLEENNMEDNMESKSENVRDIGVATEDISTTTLLPKENIIVKALLNVRRRISEFLTENSNVTGIFLKIIFGILICVYVRFVIYHWLDQGQPPLDWCRGNGLLLVLMLSLLWCVLYYVVLKPFLINPCMNRFNSKETNSSLLKTKRRLIAVLIWLFGGSICVFVLYDSYTYMRRLISFCGIFVFIFIGFIFSKHPAHVPWKTIAVGTIMQYAIGLIGIRWHIGRSVFMCVGDLVNGFLTFGYVGAEMVFGKDLVTTQAIFAFQALSVIFFMSMVVQVLFYLGWMQVFCKKLGWCVQFFMGTTVCESVNAVSSVFLGMTEAPFLYKPYLKDLTRSEIHAVMVGGLSTVAGTVFAAYASLGAQPAHLITASVMTAPAALMYAKLLFPESEKTKTDAKNFQMYKSEDSSIVDAATQGAILGVPIVQSIIASVIAAVSFVACANFLVSWLLSQAGVAGVNLEVLVSYALVPVAWIIGVRSEDCTTVARLVGIKTIVNEFVGYTELGKIKKQGLLSARSEAIATYSMCSFANPGSVAILAANLLIMCPQQRQNITAVTVRAFFGGVISSLLTACVAGSLMPEEGFPEIDAGFNSKN